MILLRRCPDNDEHDRHENGQGGFTLIEMLVTLCVVALLGIAIAGGLSQLGRMRTITQTVAAEQELDAAIGYLQDLVARSQLLPLVHQGDGKASLIGDQQSLRLVSQARTASDRQVLWDIQLALAPKNGSMALVERHIARRALDRGIESEFTVLAGITHLRVRYLSRLPTGKLSWDESWSRESRPLAIAIRIGCLRDGRTLSAEGTVFLNR